MTGVKIVSLFQSKLRARGKAWLAALTALLALAFALAWATTGFRGMQGWLSITAVVFVAAALLWLGWRLLAFEQPPAWLWRLLVIAAVLRLGVGVLWGALLPLYGHGNPAERQGYVMGDAFSRDTLAWRMARSNAPLRSAFQDNRQADQYGGLLFISAAVYRYLGGSFHQPLLMVLIASAFSALAVIFTWGFARQAWGEGEARLAAWLLAIYPEAVLLGSSQMREAFTIPLIMAGLYGVLRYTYYPSKTALLFILVPLLICLPISPPAAALLLAGQMLVLGGLRLARPRSGRVARSLLVGLGVFIPLLLVGLYLAMRQFAPERIVNPLEMLSWYVTKSAQFQGYLTQHASGWVQKIFSTYRPGVRLPLLLAYGVVQPFLPAALIAGSESSMWVAIAIWRAVGWTVMLAFMLYAPFLAAAKKDGRWFNLAVCLAVWGVALVASFRGGGDMWDNPRYRAMFAGLQAALMAWAIIEHRRLGDAWLRRAMMISGMVLLWFIPWYLRRYTGFPWPVEDPFKTFGMGLASAYLLILWDWARTASLHPPQPAASLGDARPDETSA